MEEYKSFWSELSTQQKTGYIIVTLVSILLIVFIFQNLHKSPIHFLGIEFQLPVSLLIISSVGVGFGLSFMLSFRKTFRLKKEIKKLEEDSKND